MSYFVAGSFAGTSTNPQCDISSRRFFEDDGPEGLSRAISAVKSRYSENRKYHRPGMMRIAREHERFLTSEKKARDDPTLGLSAGELVGPLDADDVVGNAEPSWETHSVRRYVRDLKVKQYVYRRAAGTCEACKKTAPFKTADGVPFLEVHHIVPLAEGGADTIANAVALCPNCHRRAHYSSDSKHFTESLVATVADEIQ